MNTTKTGIGRDTGGNGDNENWDHLTKIPGTRDQRAKNGWDQGPKDKKWLGPKGQKNSQFSEGGLYVREDDQDWGSSGMNDIQKDSE